MFKLSLLVPAAAALVLAGEGIYHAVASRQQVAVSCDEFRRARPASPRVLVTGCDINFAGAGYRESSGQVEELYLPARPAGNQAVAAPFVVATRDPAAIALVRTVLGGGRRATSEQSLGVMQTVVAQLRLTDAIDGLVRTGIIERLRSRRILSGLAPPIAENAPVVDLHGTPDFLTPGLALLAGALLALLAFWPPRRGLPATAAAEPAATSQALPIGFEPASLESSQYDPEHAFDELSELREFPTSPHAQLERGGVAATAPPRDRCFVGTRGDRKRAAARLARGCRGHAARRHFGFDAVTSGRASCRGPMDPSKSISGARTLCQRSWLRREVKPAWRWSRKCS